MICIRVGLPKAHSINGHFMSLSALTRCWLSKSYDLVFQVEGICANTAHPTLCCMWCARTCQHVLPCIWWWCRWMDGWIEWACLIWLCSKWLWLREEQLSAVRFMAWAIRPLIGVGGGNDGGFGWCSNATLDCEGCMIYGVDGIVTGVVLSHLQNKVSYDIFMDGAGAYK